MRLDTAFRLSFYVTLGVACACLGQAEAFFLRWFQFVCLPLAVMVFILAWRHEGQWVIHETAANYLGIFIGLATGGWMLAQLPRNEMDLVTGGVPWPAGLLPHLGPLLLVLLAVKLFRPKKLNDFWVIQTIGLMIVTLGCVLGSEPVFAVLLILYVASLVWCLSVFHLYRARMPASPGTLFAPVEAVPATPRAADMPWRLLGAVRVVRWTAAVFALGLALFMLLPRSGTSQWEPQKLSSTAALVSGLGADPGINLNRVGTVELSPDPAFHVNVTDALGNAAKLDSNQLWRVDVVDYYLKGHWLTWSKAMEFQKDSGKTVEPIHRAQSPAGHFLRLRFTVRPPQAGGLVLAEPLDVRYVGLDPQIGENRPRVELFHAVPGGDSVVAYLPQQRKQPYQYNQIIVPAERGDRTPARSFHPFYYEYITTQPVPEPIGAWARDLLRRLPMLPPEALVLDSEDRLPSAYHAAVSRAFCRHFTTADEFRYTLNLRRHDRNLDPTADFLLNVKEGHCERFAGALALALRSLGIPARVIKGYAGASEEEEGKYVVRLDQAHSWVQVLIQDEGQWYWLTLDPTPGQGEAANPLATWLNWLSSLDAEQLWRRFLLNYNGDAQASAAYYVWQGIVQLPFARDLMWQVPAVLAAGVVVAGAWRRRARLGGLWSAVALWRRTVVPPRPGFYKRLLAALERRRDLRPQPGETPLEFAAVVAAALQQDTATVAWAALPAQAAHALYRVRFANRPLSPAEEESLDQQITALEGAL
jgi:hypothetical protein